MLGDDEIMGWNSNELEIQVEEVEEILDTNPDLYKQRTIDALNKKRYEDALKEAQLALKFGNQALEFQVLIVRVLFEMEQYEECFKYIKSSNLWNKKDDEELLGDEQNYIYYVYAYCYRECGYIVLNLDMVIISPDGKGMIPTLKEALKNKKAYKTILLTAGEYQEGEIVLQNRNITITSLKNQRAFFKNTSFDIDNSYVRLSNIRVSTESLKVDEYIFRVQNNSKVWMKNIDILGGGDEGSGGVFVQGSELVNISQCSIRSSIGVNVESGIAHIRDTHFDRNIVGVSVYSEKQDRPKAYIENCEFNRIVGEEAIAIMVGPQGYANVTECKIVDSTIGIGVTGDVERGATAKIEVANCTLHRNRANIGIFDGGEGIVCNSTISGASTYGYVVKNAGLILNNCIIKQNKQECDTSGNAVIKEDGVKRADNNAVSSTIEGAKWNLDKIAKVAWGENYTVSSAIKDTLEETVDLLSSTVEGAKGNLDKFAKGVWGENYTVSSAVKDTLEETADLFGKLFKKIF